MADETPMTIEAPPADLFKGTQPSVVDALLKDKAAAREAFIAAEKNVGMDGVVDANSILTKPTAPVVVPEKFKTPTGEVDVEKLKASTQQIDEAIQNKEAKLQEAQKSVDDLVRHYRERENKLRNTPNPDRIAAQLPPQPVQPPPLPINPTEMSNQQLLDAINADLAKNPAQTIVNLLELGFANKLRPIEEERQEKRVRENVETLARHDPRVMNETVFAAITAKLDANPELWNLKNPHKAAWLEVKEEMRLGDLPSQASQAQPSRPSAPVLGGGTPPPPQSAGSGPVTPETVLLAISQANFRDPNQKSNLGAALRELVDRDFRARK